MFVIGTAGHVDHGKSTLITRLTGIDPDRLAEEKARGLTIDLGFAWTTLPSGREIGIVDVPGHERFVHNMLAGAGQVDAVLFVVDANEGWRPQSEEHLAILDLLGARGGIVALTKIDTAPDAAGAAASVRERLAGTVMDGAAIVPVSAITGDGIDTLLAALDAMLDATPEPPDLGRPRLFVDRSFTIKGAGTVVTGTLTGGRFRESDDVEVVPAGVRARIRSIQTHRSSRAEAIPTSRVALNLAGLDRHQIRRGDAVVTPGRVRATSVVDVQVRGVRSLLHPVTSRGAFLLYAGTAEVPARLRFFNADRLGAGDTAFARLTLPEPVVAAAGDRIVLRDTGRRETVAGGLILDAHPVSGRPPADRAAQLAARAADLSPGALAARTIDERGVVPVADLTWLTSAEAAETTNPAGEATEATNPAGPVRLPSYAVSRAWFDTAARHITDALAAFHHQNPLARGMPRDVLRAGSGLEPRLFDELLASVPGIAAEATDVRLDSHRVMLSPQQDDARTKLLDELDAAGFSPPPLAELTARFGAALIKALADAGDVIVVAPGIAFTSSRIDQAKRAIAAAVGSGGGITASRARELLGTSRKYAIPLLEWLDATGFTRRAGDVRTLGG